MTLTHAAQPKLQPVESAQRQLLERAVALGAEPVGLDRALGRILAEAITSTWDLPGFDNSAMDGYAVRAADVSAATPAAPVALRVTGSSQAGAAAPPLLPRSAVRIMTGAPVPRGADAIIKQEDTQRSGDIVHIEVAEPVGTNVRRRGEDLHAGDVVLSPGHDITSIDIGVAAALGRDRLMVGRRPLVGVFSTGDELVPAGGRPDTAQVVDSNSPMLLAAVTEAGGEPRFLGVARDTRESVRSLIVSAAGCEVVVSTAGVSVGDHDHVCEVVAELGDIDTWRVALRPGKPLLIGRVAGALFLGLPGNPVSSSVTFELFVRPVIRRLQGAVKPHRSRIQVRLGETLEKPEGLETYARAVLRHVEGDLPVATSAGNQGSAMLRSLSAAECLLVLPGALASVPRDSIVEAIPLR